METAIDLIELHNARMEALEHVIEVELPQTKEQVEKLKLVLQDKAKLTDAMANAVFKNLKIIRNANLKRRSVKRAAKGDEKGAEEHAVPDEAYEKIQEEAQEHKNYLRRLKGKSASKLNVDEVWQIKNYIAERERWIAETENGTDLMDYIFKAQPLIEEYEREQQRVQKYLQSVNEEQDKLAIDEARKRQRIEGPEETNPLAVISKRKSQELIVVDESPAKKHKGSINSYLAKTDAFSRTRELQSEYLQLIGQEDITGLLVEQMHLGNDLFCEECDVERIIDYPRAAIVCPKCGISERYTEMSLRTVPFSDPVNAPKCKGTYEKKTYYERWKKMVSGQLNNEIPDEDWQTIYLECVNRRYNFINRAMLRKLLRTLGMTRHYELIPAITNELNGVPLIQWSPVEEKTLDTMFDEAVELFERCPIDIKRRSNFISYSYFFYQACTMAGYLEYRESFPLLSGIDNKKRHDAIWQWMCENKQGEPKWVFYPTV